MDFVIVIVGVPLPEVQASLNAMGVLMSTDLVDIHADMATPEDKISTQSELPYFLLIPHDSAEALMARFLKPSPKPTLTRWSLSAALLVEDSL